jgi:hypothetical protein
MGPGALALAGPLPAEPMRHADDARPWDDGADAEVADAVAVPDAKAARDVPALML